ncbi:transmembrane protein 229B-like [Anolis sagrei]|uniref:transmembrane protein 229B-like n=1 Tax=Anolis sagrei TaxID=38937 RepID=UPI0035202654
MRMMGRPLSPLYRWYIYAIHGYFSEVMFTATWAFVEDRDWKFQGVTSIWAFFIYGTCSFALEGLFRLLRPHYGLFARCTLYTICIYLWEFSTGYFLRLFDACPWDYSAFKYNFMGLVTLEYCPFWFLGSLLLERFLIHNTLRLRLEERPKSKERSMPRFEMKDD